MNNNSPNRIPEFSRKSLADFQKMLEDRYLFHKEKAEKHVAIFKPLGFAFGLAIPILAALVTFSMGAEIGIPRPLVAIMGLTLTLLTIVNSVLKPDERFAKAAHHCIALHEWKLEFDIQVAKAEPSDETAFYSMILEMDMKLSGIGKAMAEGWIPKPQE